VQEERHIADDFGFWMRDRDEQHSSLSSLDLDEARRELLKVLEPKTLLRDVSTIIDHERVSASVALLFCYFSAALMLCSSDLFPAIFPLICLDESHRYLLLFSTIITERLSTPLGMTIFWTTRGNLRSSVTNAHRASITPPCLLRWPA
jgi:hypothetical protein